MVIFHDSYVADNFQEVQVALNEYDLDAIAYGTDQNIHAMSQAFFEAVKEAEECCGEARLRALHLVGEVCSFMLSPDKRNEPFEPVTIRGGGARRSQTILRRPKSGRWPARLNTSITLSSKRG